ncbi:hypothetical protein IU500_31655 [Nocardia terpenica]|uniref:hypothetical protein n=1 Tax=Nocardia terpenica TaxID=455432 RepID=UPI0018954FE7|nr:hypothetical protein [Nocardia terpenica]MBF6066295.1 hypothetical protein [Nocardia terpenica]MBF6108575.1 hypothetical protein [Nocardia terpenica]MBF6116121.1 hypothetical protein [Nocardia terpenica]MBF6123758.1 hypothetical protein [Nocardia terpenica]MBF6157095.1 hypothetical protein [Nocardia terpenica]
MGIGARTARLRALIEHPGTGAEERAVAERMLARALRGTGPAREGGADRRYGARHGRGGRHAGLALIAELVREDIDFARAFATPRLPAELALCSPIRDAPATIAYRVDTPFDGRIVVTIDGVPREWGWVLEDGIELVSPALRALADEVAEIVDAYNHEGTDIDRRFFASVRVGDETLIW